MKVLFRDACDGDVVGTISQDKTLMLSKVGCVPIVLTPRNAVELSLYLLRFIRTGNIDEVDGPTAKAATTTYVDGDGGRVIF